MLSLLKMRYTICHFLHFCQMLEASIEFYTQLGTSSSWNLSNTEKILKKKLMVRPLKFFYTALYALASLTGCWSGLNSLKFLENLVPRRLIALKNTS